MMGKQVETGKNGRGVATPTDKKGNAKIVRRVWVIYVGNGKWVVRCGVCREKHILLNYNAMQVAEAYHYNKCVKPLLQGGRNV